MVTFASLLFTANKLQQHVKLESLEGVVSIAAMRTWLPTAAHALQMYGHRKEILGWWVVEMHCGVTEEEDCGVML